MQAASDRKNNRATKIFVYKPKTGYLKITVRSSSSELSHLFCAVRVVSLKEKVKVIVSCLREEVFRT